MTYHSVEDICSHKRATLARIIEVVGVLSIEQSNQRPIGGGWTIAEIIEHLSIVDGQMLQLVSALLRKSENATDARPSSSTFVISLDTLAQQFGTQRIATRDNFQPTGRPSIAQSLASLNDTQEQLCNLSPRLISVDLCGVTFPHWFLGPLNLGQWLAFIGYHEQRHLNQVLSILAQPDFPQVGSRRAT